MLLNRHCVSTVNCTVYITEHTHKNTTEQKKIQELYYGLDKEMIKEF